MSGAYPRLDLRQNAANRLIYKAMPNARRASVKIKLPPNEMADVQQRALSANLQQGTAGDLEPDEAAKSSDHAFLTQLETSRLLRISPRTLERMRLHGTGPPFRKFGRRVVYEISDLREWADAQTYRSTSELGGNND